MDTAELGTVEEASEALAVSTTESVVWYLVITRFVRDVFFLMCRHVREDCSKIGIAVDRRVGNLLLKNRIIREQIVKLAERSDVLQAERDECEELLRVQEGRITGLLDDQEQVSRKCRLLEVALLLGARPGLTLVKVADKQCHFFDGLKEQKYVLVFRDGSFWLVGAGRECQVEVDFDRHELGNGVEVGNFLHDLTFSAVA